MNVVTDNGDDLSRSVRSGIEGKGLVFPHGKQVQTNSIQCALQDDAQQQGVRAIAFFRETTLREWRAIEDGLGRNEPVHQTETTLVRLFRDGRGFVRFELTLQSFEG